MCGAIVRDAETRKRATVHARAVVNAAGPFADEIRQMANGEDAPMLRASAGVPYLHSQCAGAVASERMRHMQADVEG